MNALDRREIARVAEVMQRKGSVFVFGSNTKGSHGAGAAKVALLTYGAMWGVGEGIWGRSYALPTMHLDDDGLTPLTLAELRERVDRFLAFARMSKSMTFAVTRIGCGIAGFTDEEVAPMFVGAPDNCELPEGWRS